MRVVLDTNVLVSATLIRGGNEDRILRAWGHGAFDLVLSPAIVEEIRRILTHRKLRAYQWMSSTEVTALLDLLAEHAYMVQGSSPIRRCRDPHDDKFLAAGVESDSQFLVTGDKDLLAVGSLQGLQIVRPALFLKILREGSECEKD